MDCPSQKLIDKYHAGKCTPEEVEQVKAHLAQCEKCRIKITSLQATIDKTIDSDMGDEISMPPVSIFQSPDHATAVSLETMTDGYKILGELPRGGQAIVYKAVQKATKRTVAVKVLLRGPDASKRARFRFEQEINLSASLKHPNIVTIYDSGIAQQQYYYAMEFIQGKPLDEYVEAEKLSIRQVMELFNKIASAVAYAHQKGVIHRDLKPGNILVDADGEPHILDFGLAKLIDGPEKMFQGSIMTSMAGHVIGTLAFMSPEQATADPDSIDVRTDVYSIGVMMYKTLTKKFPYNVNGSMLEILNNIQNTEPAKPSKLAPQVKSEVEAIVLHSLTKESARRYQSAHQLQHDIECWLNGLPIAARSDSSLYVLYKLITKHRYASAVAGLLLVIIIAFSVTSTNLYITARHARQRAETSAELLSSELDRYRTLAQQTTFTFFLQVLSEGADEKARGLANLFAGLFVGDSKEKTAAMFLLDKKSMPEKEETFRNGLYGEYPWFVEFIVGEHYLNVSNEEDAIKAYRRAEKELKDLSDKKPQPDAWLVRHIESRLNTFGQKE